MTSFADVAIEDQFTRNARHGVLDSDIHGGQGRQSIFATSLRSKFKSVAKKVIWVHELDNRRAVTNRKTSSKTIDDHVPAWEPVYDFSFPIAQIPAHVKVIGHLTLSDFSEVRHLADGSNANVYIAKYNDETVVIKQIKESAVSDEVAEHEFDVEYGLLARVNHPNIIKVIGSGTVGVRKFIVLQYLGGGTMRNKFDAAADARKKSYFGGSSTFSFPEVLDYARQLASALSYLHSDVYPGAMFIHRDLKPDNIAFLEDGTLVLFDLGLTTVVRQGATADVTYQMTGNTGSLRYMAPEVVLDLPYNEKVDQYSYGVILWQMAKDAVPYDGASRASYIKYACKCAERPLVPRTWPAEFKALLHACWHADLHERPSFKDIIIALDHLIAKHPLK